MWDPATYLRYAGERGRPFADLLARVGADDPRTVVDLGCGPGNLTASLADRWPAASVVGVDSSAAMVQRARELARPGLTFARTDLRDWRPTAPVDVLVSNATLQWVPGHLDLLPELLGWVAPGGWFAFQVPGNFGEQSHVRLRALAASPRWRERLPDLDWPAAHDPVAYLEVLAPRAAAVEAWETTYIHVLHGADPVLGWLRGTALRPVLAALDPAEQEAFAAELGASLREAYPSRPYGTVLPYRRVFAVAQVSRATG